MLAEIERVADAYDGAFVPAAAKLLGDDEVRRLLGLSWRAFG